MKHDKVTRLASAVRWALGLWWYAAGVRLTDVPQLARLAYERGLHDG